MTASARLYGPAIISSSLVRVGCGVVCTGRVAAAAVVVGIVCSRSTEDRLLLPLTSRPSTVSDAEVLRLAPWDRDDSDLQTTTTTTDNYYNYYYCSRSTEDRLLLPLTSRPSTVSDAEVLRLAPWDRDDSDLQTTTTTTDNYYNY